MSVMLPLELLKECLRVSQTMPQLVIPVPSGYSVTGRMSPPAGCGWIFVAFSFGGHQLDGSAIPGFDFVTGKGVVWKVSWVNKGPLLTLADKTFYLTADYLYRQIFFGPRPVTDYMEVTITNTLDQTVFFSNTAFVFELPIERIMELFGRVTR